MTRTAIVTGCAGFIGSHLVQRLLADGWSVIGIDALDDYYAPSLKVQNLAPFLDERRFRFEVVDLADAQRLRRAAESWDAEVVVHLAAVAGVRLSVTDPARYVRANIVATQNVVDALCLAPRRRLVFAGSSSVYGNDSPAPFSESLPCVSPPSPYAATKRAAELLLHVAHHLHELPVTILRFFTVYGPRQRPDLAIRKFSTALLRARPITIFGDGSMARDFTHVDDIVEGIARALSPWTGIRTVNLGNRSPVSVRVLVSAIERAFGRSALVEYVPRPPGEMDVTCADISRARELFDWQPRVSLEAGLAGFAEWLAAEEASGRNP